MWPMARRHLLCCSQKTFTCLLKASVANEPACTQPSREGVVAVADRMALATSMCSSSSPERELSNPAEALTRPAQGVEAHFDDRLLPAVRDPGLQTVSNWAVWIAFTSGPGNKLRGEQKHGSQSLNVHLQKWFAFGAENLPCLDACICLPGLHHSYYYSYNLEAANVPVSTYRGKVRLLSQRILSSTPCYSCHCRTAATLLKSGVASYQASVNFTL